MVIAPENAPSRMFYGWWVALALSIIVFLSAGIPFAIGPLLEPLSADPGAAFGLAAALLLVAAILSLSIDEKARPACRAVPRPARPLPAAGGS